ncbi:MAG TPA: BON domain-containing protein [Candidatus Obscuribacterales bacterium]
MANFNYKDHDRQYESWRRYGRERGFFDRASDEIRAWFGDEEAEHRRQMDQNMEHIRSEGSGRSTGRGSSSMPEWQRRNYSGPSPRGSRLQERGRYDDPLTGRSRRFFKREDGGMFGGRQRSWDRPLEYDEYTGGHSWEPGRHEYGEQSRFGGDRDMESGMPYGRGYEGYGRSWGEEERSGLGQSYGAREQSMFGHRGRGPRSYRRSDERISDDINEQLTMHPEVDASDIEVLVENGIITLRGSVDCRHGKRLAEDIAEDVYGVREVHNELRIEKNGTNNQEQFGRSGALSR